MKGSYILLIKLSENKTIKYGLKKKNYFKKGFYVYIGSALNNIENRINRHLKSKKKLHWHIDYFLKHSKILYIFYKESNYKEECIIAELFKKKFLSIDGFGSSDCKCNSHLFYGLENNFLTFIIKNNFCKYSHQKI